MRTRLSRMFHAYSLVSWLAFYETVLSTQTPTATLSLHISGESCFKCFFVEKMANSCAGNEHWCIHKYFDY